MRLLYSLFFWLVAMPLWAQLVPVSRAELPIDPNSIDAYTLLPLRDRGALLTYKHDELVGRGGLKYAFSRLDTLLKPIWLADFAPKEHYVPVSEFTNNLYRYHLFAEINSENIQILRLNIEDGTTEAFVGKLPSTLDLTQFKVMGNIAYLAGYYRDRPVVMGFSLFDGSTRIFQGLYSNNVEIGSMDIDEYRQEVHVLTHSPKKRCQFIVRSYSPDGKPLRTIEYDGTQYSLISGQILPISANESLLIGNYSADCTPFSQGIYVTRIQHDETGRVSVRTDRGDAIRYIDFSEMKNFFNYLNPRQQHRVLAKVSKRQSEGKNLKFRYRLLVHNLIPTDEGLTLVAEVYYQQYRSTASIYTGNSYPINAINRPGRVIDNYQYTHAFLCGLDQQGNLLWDNCLPLKELESRQVVPKVEVMYQNNYVVMAYPNEGTLHSQLISRDSVLAENEVFTLQPKLKSERIVSTAEPTIHAWYGPYFLATGYQRVGPDRNAFSPTRDIFYLAKFRYDPHPSHAQQPIEATKSPNPGH